MSALSSISQLRVHRHTGAAEKGPGAPGAGPRTTLEEICEPRETVQDCISSAFFWEEGS